MTRGQHGVCFVEAAGVSTCADLLVRTSCRISSRSPADVMSCAIAPGRIVVVVVVVVVVPLLAFCFPGSDAACVRACVRASPAWAGERGSGALGRVRPGVGADARG